MDTQLIETGSQIITFPATIMHDGSASLISQMLNVDLDTPAAIQGPPQTLEPTSTIGTSGRAPQPGLIPDFPLSLANLTFSASDPIDMLEPVATLSTHSPSSTSAVSSTSHASSSPVNGLPPGFVPGTSSLASALDDNRTRTNSSASPPHFIGTTKIEPVTGPDSVIKFSSEIIRPVPLVEISTIPTGSAPTKVAPLQAVDNMLRRVQESVFSAREACSMGQPVEANTRVEELIRTVQAVADLIASTHIVDGPASPNASRTGYSPPAFPPPGTNESMDYDHNVLDLIADPSRKRCASSLGPERVIKAPKLEPLDDPPLHSIQPSIGVAPLHALPTVPSVVNSTIQTLNPATAPPFPPFSLSDQAQPPASSLPPSQPASRPPSAGSSRPSLISASNIPPPLTLNQSVNSSLPSQISSAPFSSPPATTVSWVDTRAHFPGRPHHQHSNSGGSVHSIIPMSEPPALGYAQMGNGFTSTFPPSHPPPPSVMSVPMVPVPSPPHSAHVVRPSRSSSLSNVYLPTTFDVHQQAIPTSSRPQTPIVSSPDEDCDESDGDDHSHSPPLMTPGKNKRPRTDDSGQGGGSRPKNGRRTSTTDANEIPAEYKVEVDRIFFEFLGNICSNLDATDAKGEAIHQTLMAKKMQRLDESPDYRPFKFRIQAFTNAFLEELARQNLSDDKIPMKKVRNYLWNQPYISRFNEEGKKTKSKGNHIWHIDAKKSHDGGWKFRPFHRRLAGSPPTVAYVGLRWSWQPRVWDPQGAKFNGSVRYSSPSLPTWLSWKDDMLAGVPPADAQSCEVTVTAEFNVDGQDEYLSQTIQITIAPMTAIDSTLSTSRRPSLIGAMDPRRPQADPGMQHSGSSSQTWMGQHSLGLSPAPAPHVTPNAQIVQVLNTAVEQVAQAVQEQVVSSRHPVEHSLELQALAKQQHVLSVSAQALDDKEANPAGSSSTANVLVAAAHQVVYKAAVQVATTNSVIQSLPVTTTQLSVQDVSAATLSAVAQAVDLVGPLSSEVDVMMTASSLLSHQAANAPIAPGNIPTSGPPQVIPIEMQH